MRRSQCWKAIHNDFVNQTGYTNITNKQMQKKWSNYLHHCKLQYSKGLGISNGINDTKVEIKAKEEKTLKEADSFNELRINKSRVSHKTVFNSPFIQKPECGKERFLIFRMRRLWC